MMRQKVTSLHAKHARHNYQSKTSGNGVPPTRIHNCLTVWPTIPRTRLLPLLVASGKRAVRMRPEMCVDTHRLFCYSTRLVIYAGVSTGALRSGLGESKKQSKGRKMIMKAYARVESVHPKRNEPDGANPGGRMKRKFRFRAILPLACFGLMLLAGCHGGGGDRDDYRQPQRDGVCRCSFSH